MFFIGVFGIENKEKIIKETQKIYCKECNEYVEGKIIKVYSFFHFFFIPLFKWNEKYYVIYNNCNHIYSISKEKGKNVEHDDNYEISYWDLKDFEGCNYESNSGINNKCFRCGRELERNYIYCPYCGQKIR